VVKVITIIGTRPEGIKTVMLHKQLMADSGFEAILCSTGQHSTLLHDAIRDFDVEIDVELDAMIENASLSDQLSYMMKHLQSVVSKHKPSLIIVQGDTLSAYCGAMIAFYNNIKLAHIEAGLRTYDKSSPYPEEIHRKYIDDVADYHFAHSDSAMQALLNEGHQTSHVHMVGNTGIDALLYIRDALAEKSVSPSQEISQLVESFKTDYKLALLTLHRRESVGQQQEEILKSILHCAEVLNLKIICPMHPNPMMQEVYDKYKSNTLITFINALDYTSMVWLMLQVDIIYSDSGGIQEEAPYLGKRVVVLRAITERQEMIDFGCHVLFSRDSLLEDSNQILGEGQDLVTPYGDGDAAEQIVEVLR
jgi:UDP-N-acetylglucosamine 2-epimerase (non-hydrolysing)